jgi:hypothetical protein
MLRLTLSLLMLPAAAAAAPVLKIVTAGWDDPCRDFSYCSADNVPRFAVQRSTVAALTGSGFTAASSTAVQPRCRLTPSGSSTWNFGGGELPATLYVNLSILNDTHAQCTLPNASSNGLDTPLPPDRRACRGDGGGQLPCKAFAQGKLCNDTALIGVGSDRDSVAACYDWCNQDSACRFFSLSSGGWCIRYSGCRLRTTNDPSYTTYQLESGGGTVNPQGQLAAGLAGGAPFVEGPGTIAVSVDGRNWSSEYRISYVNLFSAALGRRPYISEPEGHLVFTSADKAMFDPWDTITSLTVEASLPSVPGKTWTWPNVTVGTDVLLPLDFDGLPARLHNDMSISVTIHSSVSPDEKLTVWRRFMRVPPPPAGSRVEAVQLDATRGGILVGGKPFLGRGYYINRLSNNKSVPASYSVPAGISAEIRRLSGVTKPGDTPIINMGEIYGLGSDPDPELFSVKQMLAVLDAAAEVGFKVMYDMTFPGVHIQAGGPFNNESRLHWLRSNVTLVRNHPALLGYYVCDDCCGSQRDVSMQAQVYTLIKDLDPYHAIIGAANCGSSFLFRDIPSLLPATVSRVQAWMGHGQPALQLSLDLVMQENYGISLAAHAAQDGQFVRGMFQEPVINCDGNIFNGQQFPHFATNGTYAPPWLRSTLWLGAVSGNMVNQLMFILDELTPEAFRAEMSAYAQQALELLPSLYGAFGTRDSVRASLPTDYANEPYIRNGRPVQTRKDLVARAWTESDHCTHVVLVNINTTRPAQFQLQLTGGRFAGPIANASQRRQLLGGGGGHRANAERLFEGRYTIPINGDYRDNGGYDTFMFSDWVGPGMTNVYRIGGVSRLGEHNPTEMLARCSEGAGWQG